MNCQNCGNPAPEDIKKMLEEDGYFGDYFCSDECRDTRRAQEESKAL